MRHLGMLLGGLAVAGIAWAAAAAKKKPAGPQFDAGEYTLIVTALKSDSEVKFSDKPKGEYSISLNGQLEAPEGADAVCARKYLSVKSAKNDRGKRVLKPKKRGRAGSAAEKYHYNAFHGLLAKVELKKTDLLANAYTVGTMTVTTDVVIAKKRQEKELPAVVMEEFKQLIPGVRVRITGLTMSPKRELRVNVDYKRSVGGTAGPFLEAVWPLDKTGKVIGGGRWTEGNGPFGKTGRFIGKYKLTSRQVHEAFRFVIVTHYDKKSLTAEIDEVFQK